MAGQERIFHEILSQSSPSLPFQGISQSWSISLYCNAWTPFFGLRTQRSRLSNDRLEGTKHLEVSLFDRLTGRQAWKFLDVCSNMFQLDGVYGLPRWIPCCVRHSEASSCRSCALSFHESLCLTEYGRHGSWIMSPQNASSIASISKLPPALTCTFWEAFRYFWNYCLTPFCAILGLKFNTVRFAFKCTSL